MKVSVIIPTYNAESYLIPLLESLSNQTISFELIIIDSSSTDNTLHIAKQFTSHITVIPHHKFDHGGTRTEAAKKASGEIIFFLTQDALPCHTNTLETLLEVFNESRIVASYGRQIAYKKTNIFGQHLRAFNYPPKSYVRTFEDKDKYGIKTGFLSDSFAAYRKSALAQIGWFKDGLIVGEDAYAGAKLLLEGYALSYCAQAEVYHSHSYTIIEEFKRYFDIGVFHQQESWIHDTFGKAEKIGNAYIKSEFNYLLHRHYYHRIPEFFIRNSMKYIGYKLGKSYTYLPHKWIKHISMHPNWWKNKTS